MTSASSTAMLTMNNLPNIPSLSGKMGHMSDTQIDKVSKDFEAMFISQMTESMFGDSAGSSAFGSEESGDIYKGLMMEQYGKQITASGGIGIASYVKTELLKLQEV